MSNKEDLYFKSRMSFEPKRDDIWRPIVRYLEKYFNKDSKILELGAGYCSFINQVSATEKHALDRSDVIKQYAKEDVKVHITDASNTRIFQSDYFDVVFSSFLFEHLTRDQLNYVMRELRRILHKDGVLITLLPNFKLVFKHYFDDYTHLQIFSHLSFKDYLISQGFEITHVEGRFLPYSFKSRLPKSALLTKIYLALPWRPFAGNMLVIAKNPEVLTPPSPRMAPPRNPRMAPPRRNMSDSTAAPIPSSILKVSKFIPDKNNKTPAGLPGTGYEGRDGMLDQQNNQRRGQRYRPRRNQGDRSFEESAPKRPGELNKEDDRSKSSRRYYRSQRPYTRPHSEEEKNQHPDPPAKSKES